MPTEQHPTITDAPVRARHRGRYSSARELMLTASRRRPSGRHRDPVEASITKDLQRNDWSLTDLLAESGPVR